MPYPWPTFSTATYFSFGRGHSAPNVAAVYRVSTGSMATAGNRGCSHCSGRPWEDEAQGRPGSPATRSYLCLAVTHLQSSRGPQRPAHSSASATSSCQGPGPTVCRRCCSSVPRSTWKSFRGERCPAGVGMHVSTLILAIHTSFRGLKLQGLWDGPCTEWEKPRHSGYHQWSCLLGKALGPGLKPALY